MSKAAELMCFWCRSIPEDDSGLNAGFLLSNGGHILSNPGSVKLRRAIDSADNSMTDSVRV